MTREISVKRHVALIRAAQKRNDKSAKDYLPGTDVPDKEMVAMYRDDNKDYERIIKHLQAGKFKLAYNVLDNMDTAARENIWQTYNVLVNKLYPY